MTLKEMKIKTFSLIEEYYPEAEGLAEDEDVLNKVNGVVNQIQMDLMAYRKINAKKVFDIKEEDEKEIDIKSSIDDLYQIRSIYFDETIDYKMPNEDTIILPSDFVGKFIVYYYKYPKMVKTTFENEEDRKKEDEEFEFELDQVLLEIAPYGIAADLLKMDMISGYGRYFYERYLEMQNKIDPRKTNGIIMIEGGVDV